MAGYDALAPLAQMLGSLPDESVEGLLSAFDAVVGAGNAAQRPAASQLLRDTAANCQNPARRDRLLRAAADVEAGQLCGPAITFQEPPPEPVWPAAPEVDAIDDDEDDSDGDPYMEDAPPQLPHLPVRHFFPGLVVRVAQDFRDVDGRPVCAQDLLKVFHCVAEGEGYRVSFRERTVPLASGDIVENAGNAWFQPVPTVECLDDLAEAIDRRLEAAEEAGGEEDDAEYEALVDRLDDLHGELAACREWLARDGARGPAPKCRGGAVAAKVFGSDDIVTAWIRLLFAAVPVCAG